MTDLQYTPVEEIEKVRPTPPLTLPVASSIILSQIHASLQAGFKSGKPRDIKYRKHQLLQLAYLLKDNKSRIEEATKQDLGRSYAENEMYVLRGLAPTCRDPHLSLASSITSPLTQLNTPLTTSRNGPSRRASSFPSISAQGRIFARNQKALS